MRLLALLTTCFLACGPDAAVDPSAQIDESYDESTAGLTSCANRPGGRTQIDAVVTVESGIKVATGRNGAHQLFDGTITTIKEVANASVVTTKKIHAAMNIMSARDPHGLDVALPLKVGQTIELVGEYIPASQANAAGGRAVVHFTHNPCGSVTYNGKIFSR
jgi:hypothetical protein